MRKINSSQKGETLLVLNGDITGEKSLKSILGDLSGKPVLNCKGIKRLNSVGIREWVQYFSEQRSKGVQLTFEECSPAVVNQMRLFKNFLPLSEVRSVSLPLICEECDTEVYLSVLSSELQGKKAEDFSSEKCPSCGQKRCTFDDDESYFELFEPVEE